MPGSGSVFKRCGCRDPLTKRQLNSKCPKSGQRGHGAWYVSLPVWATTDNLNTRLRQGGYRTKAQALAALERITDRTLSRPGSRLTTGQWLERWFEDEAERSADPVVMASSVRVQAHVLARDRHTAPAVTLIQHTAAQLSGSYDRRPPEYLAALGLMLLRGVTVASAGGDRATTAALAPGGTVGGGCANVQPAGQTD